MVISLVMLPGSGQRDVTLPAGSTLADLLRACPEAVGRQLVLQGETVLPSAFASTLLRSGVEVGALGASKGN